jgi:hypothetical protein
MYVVLYPERVKTLRERFGMTKRDPAAAAGVLTITARNAERGVPVRIKAATNGSPRRPSRSTRPSAWAARRIVRRLTNLAGVVPRGTPAFCRARGQSARHAKPATRERSPTRVRTMAPRMRAGAT